MTMLVTGASGFVGRHVVEELNVRQLDVLTIDHRWDTVEDVEARIARTGVEGCIHLGWYAHPEDYVSSVRGNASSLSSCLELAEVLNRHGCETLVVAGTGLEYGPGDGSRRAEDSPLSPVTVYGSAKALCHAILTAGRWRRRLAWARLFNVIGPGEHPDRIIPSVTRSLLAGRPIDLTSGEQVRDYIDVRDAAAALVDLATQGRAGTYNVCRGEPTRLRTVLEGLARRVDRMDLLRFGEVVASPWEPLHLVGDPERIQDVRERSPRDLGKILDDVVSYWRESESD